MENIQLFDFKNVNKVDELVQIAANVINSKSYISGSFVKNFEERFANYIGVKHCIGVGNGTDALKLGLRALGADRNSKIGTVTNAGFYTSSAIFEIGAIPIYLDINEKDLLLDIDKLRIKLSSESIDVLVITHLYGQMVDMPEVLNLAKIYNFKILEDCAQAHGADINGKKAGSFGDLASSRFIRPKILEQLAMEVL